MSVMKACYKMQQLASAIPSIGKGGAYLRYRRSTDKSYGVIGPALPQTRRILKRGGATGGSTRPTSSLVLRLNIDKHFQYQKAERVESWHATDQLPVKQP